MSLLKLCLTGGGDEVCDACMTYCEMPNLVQGRRRGGEASLLMMPKGSVVVFKGSELINIVI